MKRTKLSQWVFLVGVAVGVAQIVMMGSLLPSRVASHFGASGVADGFMSREAFLAMQWTLTGFVAALFFSIAALLRVLPHDAINLPNKDYWLAPERRTATLDYVSDRMYAFGAATFALLTGVGQQVYEANIRGTLTLGTVTGVYLLCYLLYTAIWCAALFKRFSLPATPRL